MPPLPAGTLKPGALALDMMYGAATLPFLRWARAQGAVARDGLGMLVEQASEAYFVWLGVRPGHVPGAHRAAARGRRAWPQRRGQRGSRGVNPGLRSVGRLVGMLAVAVLALQLFFLLRIALMLVRRARVHHVPAQRDLAHRRSRSTSCRGRRRAWPATASPTTCAAP